VILYFSMWFLWDECWNLVQYYTLFEI